MLDLPVVRHKDKEDQFEWKKIMYSLMKETGLKQDIAKEIAIEVYRFVMANDLKIVTGPLLREISNVFLLSHGYELARLKNTRIGKPMFDLKEMRIEGLDMNGEVSKHVEYEYNAVNNLIMNIEIRGWIEQRKKLIGECDSK